MCFSYWHWALPYFNVFFYFLSLLQTTHVAAQYGQTAFLYHIVTKWNADPDVPDNDGRSPLHWCVKIFSYLCFDC